MNDIDYADAVGNGNNDDDYVDAPEKRRRLIAAIETFVAQPPDDAMQVDALADEIRRGLDDAAHGFFAAPDEMILHIARRLPVRTIARLAAQARYLRRLFADVHLWRFLLRRDFLGVPRTDDERELERAKLAQLARAVHELGRVRDARAPDDALPDTHPKLYYEYLARTERMFLHVDAARMRRIITHDLGLSRQIEAFDDARDVAFMAATVSVNRRPDEGCNEILVVPLDVLRTRSTTILAGEMSPLFEPIDGAVRYAAIIALVFSQARGLGVALSDRGHVAVFEVRAGRAHVVARGSIEFGALYEMPELTFVPDGADARHESNETGLIARLAIIDDASARPLLCACVLASTSNSFEALCSIAFDGTTVRCGAVREDATAAADGASDYGYVVAGGVRPGGALLVDQANTRLSLLDYDAATAEFTRTVLRKMPPYPAPALLSRTPTVAPSAFQFAAAPTPGTFQFAPTTGTFQFAPTPTPTPTLAVAPHLAPQPAAANMFQFAPPAANANAPPFQWLFTPMATTTATATAEIQQARPSVPFIDAALVARDTLAVWTSAPPPATTSTLELYDARARTLLGAPRSTHVIAHAVTNSEARLYVLSFGRRFVAWLAEVRVEFRRAPDGTWALERDIAMPARNNLERGAAPVCASWDRRFYVGENNDVYDVVGVPTPGHALVSCELCSDAARLRETRATTPAGAARRAVCSRECHLALHAARSVPAAGV